MNPRQDFGAAVSPILTRAELEARLAARAKPLPDRHPAPGGELEAEVNRTTARAGEDRIRLLQDELKRRGDGVYVDHALAQRRGRAKADFGRCG